MARGTSSSATFDKIKTRSCRVCGKPTRFAHLQIDACRACAVFYSRHKNHKLKCLDGSMQCDTTKGGKKCCRKCRRDRFDDLLGMSMEASRANEVGIAGAWHKLTASSSNAVSIPANIKPAESVLSALRRGHALMNATRRSRELGSRRNVSNGILIDDMILIPTTHEIIEQTTRILVTAIWEFASTSFVEFNTFDQSDQWKLVRNFYPFFSILDSEYRTMTFLPDEPTMSFASYSTYYDVHTIAHFLPAAMSESNKAEAIRLVSNLLDVDIRKMRAKMRLWNPSENEFIAFLGLSFWSLDSVSVSAEIQEIACKYRRRIFGELHGLYGIEMRLDEYASRLGETLMFLASIQSFFSEELSQFGVLKLLDVMGEDTIVARLNSPHLPA